MKQPIGIDISSETLDYYYSNFDKKVEKGVIANDTSSILEFLNGQNAKNVFLVLEPTGTYGDKLVELAHRQGFEIQLANPKKSSKFMEVLELVHKTDENAAMALYLMGKSQEVHLPRFIPQSEVMKQRKQIQMTVNALSKQSRMLKNQIHAMEQRFDPNELAMNALKTTLQTLEEQLDTLKKELLQSTDEEIEEF